MSREINLMRARNELRDAVKYGEIENAKQLLDAEPRSIHTAQEDDYSILWDACNERNSIEMLRLLLDRGADVHGHGYPHSYNLNAPQGLLHLCIERREPGFTAPAVRLLLERGARVDELNENDLDPCTPLYLAASNGDLATIRHLLDAGANISRSQNSYEERTPLGEACAFGMHEAVQLLLERGADIEMEDEDGTTPLMHAVLNGESHAVRVLLASGVDIDRVCVDVKLGTVAPDPETVAPLAIARRRKGVLAPGSHPFLADEINSLFDVALLARLIVAGRRPGPLAARRRVLGLKDLTRYISKFLARKLLSESPSSRSFPPQTF